MSSMCITSVYIFGPSIYVSGSIRCQVWHKRISLLFLADKRRFWGSTTLDKLRCQVTILKYRGGSSVSLTGGGGGGNLKKETFHCRNC